MKIYRFRLNVLGWLGAAMFILPTPLAVWETHSILKKFAEKAAYNRALEQVRGVPILPEYPLTYYTLLFTISLVGFVLLLVGREIVSD